MRVPWFFQNTRDSCVTEVERRMESQIVVEQRGQPQHNRHHAEFGALLRVAQQVKEDRHKQNNLCPVTKSQGEEGPREEGRPAEEEDDRGGI